MAGESPAAVLFDSAGVELAVVDATAIPPGTRALLFAGRDPSGKARFVAVDAQGRLLEAVSIQQPTSAVVTAVMQTTSTTTLLAANPLRLGASVCNNISTGLLYLKFGAGATSTNFSTVLLPGATCTLPFPAYQGELSGVWSTTGSGTAQVTETS